MVEFIASPGQMEHLLPTISMMVGERRITITDVEIDNPSMPREILGPNNQDKADLADNQ